MTADLRIGKEFFQRDVLEIAPALLGTKLVRVMPDGSLTEHLITETEAYRGEEDKACHASRGRTARTSVMYLPGGVLYVYLIYGIHWLMNIVTGSADDPQAVLIRGIASYSGPGRVTRALAIDRSFNGESLLTSDRIWIEQARDIPAFRTAPRVGIDYAGEYWKEIPWRFIAL